MNGCGAGRLKLLLRELVISEQNDDEITELEWRLQVATADYLQGRIYHGPIKFHATPIPFHHLKFHHPALEYRGEAEGAKYKRRGSTPGIPDWLFWGPNKLHATAELKVAGRGLNANQKDCHRWLIEYGFPYAICRSVAQLRDFIISLGFQCHNMACREPDHRTKEQKFADVHAMYKRYTPKDNLADAQSHETDMPPHDPL